jgi:hypothetical protein
MAAVQGDGVRHPQSRFWGYLRGLVRANLDPELHRLPLGIPASVRGERRAGKGVRHSAKHPHSANTVGDRRAVNG